MFNHIFQPELGSPWRDRFERPNQGLLRLETPTLEIEIEQEVSFQASTLDAFLDRRYLSVDPDSADILQFSSECFDSEHSVLATFNSGEVWSYTDTYPLGTSANWRIPLANDYASAFTSILSAITSGSLTGSFDEVLSNPGVSTSPKVLTRWLSNLRQGKLWFSMAWPWDATNFLDAVPNLQASNPQYAVRSFWVALGARELDAFSVQFTRFVNYLDGYLQTPQDTFDTYHLDATFENYATFYRRTTGWDRYYSPSFFYANSVGPNPAKISTYFTSASAVNAIIVGGRLDSKSDPKSLAIESFIFGELINPILVIVPTGDNWSYQLTSAIPSATFSVDASSAVPAGFAMNSSGLMSGLMYITNQYPVLIHATNGTQIEDIYLNLLVSLKNPPPVTTVVITSPI